MNKKILAILVASLAAAAIPATAWSGPGGGKGGDHGGSHGGSAGSSGHGNSGKPDGGSGFAPDKAKDGVKQAGYDVAPGQLKKAAVEADDDNITVGGVGRINFGTVISSIRAGKSSLAGVDGETQVNVVDVADLLRGKNSVALDNALADQVDQISALRDDLAALGLTGLDPATVDDVVAARKAKNGSLSVFVYNN